MKITKQEIRKTQLSELKVHPQNPRKGDVSKIAESIEENGFYGTIVAHAGTGHILAGNHRYLAAIQQGITEVDVAWLTCSKQTALKILLADNKTSDGAGYDDQALAKLLEELSGDAGLIGTGYDDNDLEALLASLETEATHDAPEDDEEQICKAEELQKKWKVKPGQIWEVGNHKIACGSSTDIDLASKLIEGHSPMVFTDPPYGIKVVKSSQVGRGGPVKFGKVGGGKVVASSKYRPIENDDSVEIAEEFLRVCDGFGVKDFIVWGGNYMTDFLPASRCWIVWDKENTGNFADGELAWTSFDKGVKIYRWLWNGMSRKGDRKTEGLTRHHPTQKPVGLHLQILQEFNPDKNPVLDGFLGSGTTILACEDHGCKGFGIDIEPSYVAVTLERFQLRGIEPKLMS